MTAVMHFVADDADPWGLVARYMAALAPGSYLALSHATYDKLPPQRGRRRATRCTQRARSNIYLRTKAEVAAVLRRPRAGVAATRAPSPAISYVGLWGAEDPDAADSDGSRGIYCGVARRP